MNFFSKLKIILLFIIAFLPRVFDLGGNSLFADEITWMSRSKAVYAAVRSGVWEYFKTGWWLDKTMAEPIGIPVTFLGGVAMTYLTPGYSSHSLNITRDFIATRIPEAIIGILFVPVFYLLLKKFTNDKIAFITALLIALDPVSISLSRWLHQDMALMAFSTLSLLIFFYSDRKVATIFSAIFASMTILTKPQGFIVPLTVFAVCVIGIVKKEKINLKRLGLWVLVIISCTVLFFPFLWHEPIKGMIQYLSTQIGNANNGQLTFFNGQITTSPPWYYYFAIFPFRVPESVFMGLLVGLILGIQNLRKSFFGNKFIQVAIIYSVIFLFTISLSNKKIGIRYLFGIWPYIYITAVYGLTLIEKHVKKVYKWAFWLVVFLFPVWGILKFYPSYYLYYNHFISPQKFQSLESIAFCDGVKPSVEYLEPKLYHGITIMLSGCDSGINYYTGFTINRVNNVSDKPEYVIEETHDAQKFPNTVKQIRESGYKEIKQIDFRGIILAKIYQKP